MFGFGILSGLVFLPLLGALAILVLPGGDAEATKRNARWIALWTTLVTFAVSLVLVVHFDAELTGAEALREAVLALAPVATAHAADRGELDPGPVAFTLANIVGLAVAGPVFDRFGIVRPLAVGTVSFAGGLLISSLAPTMSVIVLGRVFQGLGAGALSVAAYLLF